MITKDISLVDCILDLIDNSLDGARKAQHAASPEAILDNYNGFHANVDSSAQRFHIADNCGGIKLSEAIDYAFHFGRRLDAPTEGDYSIGLYGIGMKRAIFKMGNKIEIYSSTDQEAFRTKIDVKEWLARALVSVPGQASAKEDWDFDMDDAEVNPDTGTSISIDELHPSISAQFANPEFENSLARIVARDYAQFSIHSSSEGKRTRTVFTPPGARRLTAIGLLASNTTSVCSIVPLIGICRPPRTWPRR
jgi:hypothetical protein